MKRTNERPERLNFPVRVLRVVWISIIVLITSLIVWLGFFRDVRDIGMLFGPLMFFLLFPGTQLVWGSVLAVNVVAPSIRPWLQESEVTIWALWVCAFLITDRFWFRWVPKIFEKLTEEPKTTPRAAGPPRV